MSEPSIKQFIQSTVVRLIDIEVARIFSRRCDALFLAVSETKWISPVSG